jgi:hypothetical protein
MTGEDFGLKVVVFESADPELFIAHHDLGRAGETLRKLLCSRWDGMVSAPGQRSSPNSGSANEAISNGGVGHGFKGADENSWKCDSTARSRRL